MLAAGLIRDPLQAHLVLARVGEQPQPVDADLAPRPDESEKFVRGLGGLLLGDL